jgi:hypothetical protein
LLVGEQIVDNLAIIFTTFIHSVRVFCLVNLFFGTFYYVVSCCHTVEMEKKHTFRWWKSYKALTLRKRQTQAPLNLNKFLPIFTRFSFWHYKEIRSSSLRTIVSLAKHNWPRTNQRKQMSQHSSISPTKTCRFFPSHSIILPISRHKNLPGDEKKHQLHTSRTTAEFWFAICVLKPCKTTLQCASNIFFNQYQ